MTTTKGNRSPVVGGYRRVMRRAPTIAAALALGLLVGGCSGSDDTPTSTATSPDAPVLQPGRPGEPNTSLTGTSAVATPTKKHNDADVTFLRDMIVHHAQAVVMSDLVEGRLTDPAVRRLADRISAEQKPEMRGMASTLRRWDEKVPPQAKNPSFGMRDGHGDHAGMPGMATRQQLDRLAKATGVEADRQYLDLMITHHEGAIDMCDTHGEAGIDARTGELADDITVSQRKQISQMKTMRDRL